MRFAKTLFLFAAALLSSCFSDKEDKVILLVECSDTAPRSGQIVRFDIKTFTTDDSRLSELQINSFDAENGRRNLETIALDAKRYEDSWYYTVPVFRERDTDLEVQFLSAAANGYTQRRSIKFVISTSQLLDEYSGITLYSPYSGSPDGFSLATMRPVLTAESAADEVDIYVSADDEDAVLHTLRSKTDILFSRANNFNYASATAFSLSETYAASVPYNKIDNLDVNDVVLFGRGDVALGVMKVVSITEGEGGSEGFIMLNIKVIM